MTDATHSAPEDVVILVDAEDQPLGTEAKAACHRHPVPLHRAFSVFLYDEDGRMLITKRSAEKATWPGYWSNACCSHPRPGEDTTAAAHRRLREELGTDAAIEYRVSFTYEAHYDDTWGEHEFDHVFVGRLVEPLAYDPAEVEAVEMVEPKELEWRLAAHPERFTPWFRIACAKLRTAEA